MKEFIEPSYKFSYRGFIIIIIIISVVVVVHI